MATRVNAPAHRNDPDYAAHNQEEEDDHCLTGLPGLNQNASPNVGDKQQQEHDDHYVVQGF